MPHPRMPARAVARLAVRWLATIALGFVARAALADHFAPVSPKRGFDWMTWLLVAGAVAAVGLAAWAFFAPERPASRAEQPGPDPAEPESTR
jgi:hypothetical protein